LRQGLCLCQERHKDLHRWDLPRLVLECGTCHLHNRTHKYSSMHACDKFLALCCFFVSIMMYRTCNFTLFNSSTSIVSINFATCGVYMDNKEDC
jgi:hypothetical protein